MKSIDIVTLAELLLLKYYKEQLTSLKGQLNER